MKELQTRNQEMFEALKSKHNLLSILSHDVTNYLTIMQGANSIISRTKNDQTRTKYLEKSKRAIHKVTQIVEMVRDMEAFEQGKKVVNILPVDLKRIMTELLFTFEQKLEQKDMLIEVQIEEGANWVLAEPRALLNQVLNNLVSNSIKFSDRNKKIEISSKVVESFVVLTIKSGVLAKLVLRQVVLASALPGLQLV